MNRLTTLSMLGVLAGLFIVASLFVPVFDIQTISNQLSQQMNLLFSLWRHIYF